jgi:hypothetical protein
MRTQIVVFGTNHPLQCGSNSYTAEQVETFRAHLEEICLSHEIAFVAEEMSCDGLSRHGKEASVAAGVASKLRIKYDHIDLEGAERNSLSIDDGSLAVAAIKLGSGESIEHLRDELTRRISDPVRECCWFARILAANAWPTLFICGANHVGNMCSLIGSIGLDVVIVEHDYMP